MQRLVSGLGGSAFYGSTFWLRPNAFDCAIQSGSGALSRCRPPAHAAAHAAKARPICSLVVMWFGVAFTTHDPNHALRAADRAYLLRGGERLAEGPVQQILTRERLEALYGAPVQTITDATGTAFIPG